jgi:predicted DNA-binding transcriptional regulator AlpA
MARKRKTRAKRGPRKKLLTLSEIHHKTGIAMATLAKYVRQSPRKFPSEGRGRRRRYYRQAVEVFKKMRAQSRRGPKPGQRRGALGAAGRGLGRVSTQIKRLERRSRGIERSLKRLERLARKPLRLRVLR